MRAVVPGREARAAPAAATCGRAFERALVVANPIAGRGRATAIADALVAALRARGTSAELHLTTGRGSGKRRLAEEARALDLVCAIGGDGTLSEVLDGLAERDAAVALVPFGTANLLAREFDLPSDVDGVLRVIEGGCTARLDRARVGNRPCYACAGVGVDGLVVRELDRARTGAITQWTYVRVLARVLRDYRAPELRLALDGHPVDGRFGLVIASNVRRYGAHFRLDGAARTDDGLFEVYAVPRADVPRLAAVAVQGFFSRLPGRFGSLYRARTVTVESDAPVPYQVDGDFGGETPFRLAVETVQHTLLVPRHALRP